MTDRFQRSEHDLIRKVQGKRDTRLLEFEQQNRSYDPLSGKPFVGLDSLQSSCFLKLKQDQDQKPKHIWDHVQYQEKRAESLNLTSTTNNEQSTLNSVQRFPPAKKSIRSSGFQHTNIFQTI